MKIFLAILGFTLVLATKADLIEDGDDFEGDILLTPEQRMLIDQHRDLAEPDSWTRGASKSRHWPNGVVPYVVDSSLANQDRATRVIDSAIKEWQQKTCLRFVKRTNERGYISFRLGSGCSSYVGRTGGKQSVNLARGCWYHGIVVHEIGHALGFWHEQSRPDRDEYVTIMWDNIREANKHNFNKYSDSKINSLGVPYDYGSIMHYGRRGFSKNGKDTIVPKKSVTIGQRKGLSPLDVRQMNLLYKCGGNPGTQPPVTQPPVTRPPTCRDTYSRCSQYTKYCATNAFMKKRCKKTCNIC